MACIRPHRLATIALACLCALGASAQTTSRSVDDGAGSAAIIESYESASANRSARAIVSASGTVAIVENKIRAPRGSFDRTLASGCATETSTPTGSSRREAIPGFPIELPTYRFERQPIDCAQAKNPVGSLGSIFDQEIWSRGSKASYISMVSAKAMDSDDPPPTIAQVEAYSKLPNRIYSVGIAGSKLALGTASEREAAKYLAERGAFHAGKMSEAGFAVETRGKTLRQGEKDFDAWIGAKFPEANKAGYSAPEREERRGYSTTVDVNVSTAFEGSRLLKTQQGACSLETTKILAWSSFSPQIGVKATISIPSTSTRKIAVACEPKEAGSPCSLESGDLFAWSASSGQSLSCQEGAWR